MAIADFEPPPSRDAIVEQGRQNAQAPDQPQSRSSGSLIGGNWLGWLFALVIRLNATAELKGRVGLAAQAAAIPATPAYVTDGSGLYRVSYFVRVTQAATINSAVQVTLRFTRNGTPCSFVGANVNGNTLASFDADEKLVSVDDATAITYETTYASVGGTPMQFELEVRVQAVDRVIAA